MDASALVHHLDRTILIHAERETVFRFFTDSARWASWWGAGSAIDPRIGGAVLIRYPGGTEATGHVMEIVAPERLVFSYGYASGAPIAPGSSVVTIHLEPLGHATRLRLTHAFGDAGVRDQHIQGWRYQLSLFANVVANELHAGAADVVDRWFAAWSDTEPAARDAAVRLIVTNDIRLRDQFSAIDGIDDLLEHLTAARRFMPGIRMHREGAVRHCQGMALADWIARMDDGHERARGTNVFLFDSRGRIDSVTGFWTGPNIRE